MANNNSFASKVKSAKSSDWKPITTATGQISAQKAREIAKAATGYSSKGNVIKKLREGIQESKKGLSAATYQTKARQMYSRLMKANAEKPAEIKKSPKVRINLSSNAEIKQETEQAGSRLGVQAGYENRKKAGTTFFGSKGAVEKKSFLAKPQARRLTASGGSVGSIAGSGAIGIGKSTPNSGLSSKPTPGSFMAPPMGGLGKK